MAVYAFGFAIIVGLTWVAIRVSKGAGYSEASKDIAEDITQAIIENNKQAVKDAKDISTMSRAAMRDELSK